MRVGLFSDTYLPEINGVATSVHTLRQVLEKRGHTVFVITTKSNQSEGEEDPCVLRFSGIELKKLYGYVMTSPIQIQAYKKIKEMELDLIHTHTEFSVGIFARIVAKMQNLPLVSTYHTTYEDYTHYVNIINSERVDRLAKKAVSRLSRLYIDSSTEVISPSHKTKMMLEGYKVKKNIHVVPTGLDLKRFCPTPETLAKGQEIRSSLGVTKEEFLIVYLGRVAQEKSIDLLIDGLAELRKEKVGVKLLIVGAGPEEDDLKLKAKELNIQNEVLFVGKKTAEEVPLYYQASDCFSSASITETQGMTYIEALATGLPVVTRPDEVLDELVIEGETGYYFKTPEEFSGKIQKLMSLSDEEKEKIAVQAMMRVKPYDEAVFYKNLVKVYEAAIANYTNLYRIDKIRLKSDYVQLTLIAPQKDNIKILVSVDTYFQLGYRKGRQLTPEEVDILLEMEVSVKAYQSCLRKLAMKDRTRKEMYDWLTQNTELDIAEINQIIDKLEEKGFIDDRQYVKDSVTFMKATLVGEQKIYRNLRKKGIPVELIQEILEEERDEDKEYSNALKWAQKIQPTIRDKSVKMKKNVMYQKMANQGYRGEILNRVIESLDFSNDKRMEMDSLRRVAGKAKKRYEKKNSGYELRNKVYCYCATQGFESEEIYAILDEMEWNDEKG